MTARAYQVSMIGSAGREVHTIIAHTSMQATRIALRLLRDTDALRAITTKPLARIGEERTHHVPPDPARREAHPASPRIRRQHLVLVAPRPQPAHGNHAGQGHAVSTDFAPAQRKVTEMGYEICDMGTDEGRAKVVAYEAKKAELVKSGQQLYAKIKRTSKYYGQGGRGTLFEVYVEAGHAEGYVVQGGPGGQYRLRDVNLFIVDDGREMRIV